MEGREKGRDNETRGSGRRGRDKKRRKKEGGVRKRLNNGIEELKDGREGISVKRGRRWMKKERDFGRRRRREKREEGEERT